mmetsp:Transcript_40592/g.47490  ORF Transcript_40592/g.47490 Transcript_40592/m.47490 type:complete len:351 (-) Transcript_40592:270-1322(-)
MQTSSYKPSSTFRNFGNKQGIFQDENAVAGRTKSLKKKSGLAANSATPNRAPSITRSRSIKIFSDVKKDSQKTPAPAKRRALGDISNRKHLGSASVREPSYFGTVGRNDKKNCQPGLVKKKVVNKPISKKVSFIDSSISKCTSLSSTPYRHKKSGSSKSNTFLGSSSKNFGLDSSRKYCDPESRNGSSRLDTWHDDQSSAKTKSNVNSDISSDKLSHDLYEPCEDVELPAGRLYEEEQSLLKIHGGGFNSPVCSFELDDCYDTGYLYQESELQRLRDEEKYISNKNFEMEKELKENMAKDDDWANMISDLDQAVDNISLNDDICGSDEANIVDQYKDDDFLSEDLFFVSF